MKKEELKYEQKKIEIKEMNEHVDKIQHNISKQSQLVQQLEDNSS